VVTPELALAAWHACISSRRPADDCAAALVAFAAAHDLDDDDRATLVDAVIEQMHAAIDRAGAHAAQQELDDRWFAIAHRPTWELALRDRRS
jgi:hypothetical protein